MHKNNIFSTSWHQIGDKKVRKKVTHQFAAAMLPIPFRDFYKIVIPAHPEHSGQSLE
jgi:hypothetical protein